MNLSTERFDYSFKIGNYGVELIRQDGITFNLLDRGFPTLNHEFQGLPLLFLDRLKRVKEGARVLDLGGGGKSLVTRSIAENYPGMRVYNADLIAGTSQDSSTISNLVHLRGDCAKLDLEDDSIDLILSHQFLPYFGLDEAMIYLRETARVLKPGRVALLDDALFSKMTTPEIREKQEALDSKILVLRKKLPSEVIVEILSRGYPPDSEHFYFIALARNPVEEEVQRLLQGS